jgi:hypothetical protein
MSGKLKVVRASVAKQKLKVDTSQSRRRSAKTPQCQGKAPPTVQEVEIGKRIA